MKGKTKIGDFIHQVKKELVAAQDASGQPFYELNEVQLEVSFVLEATGEAGFSLYVVEFGGQTKAAQTHKVTLKLKPLVTSSRKQGRSSSTTGGGAAVDDFGKEGGPYYEPPVV